ncbi:MAG: hypothetical protein ACPLX7_02015 [Candidatus Kapaibacteriota bacterium]
MKKLIVFPAIILFILISCKENSVDNESKLPSPMNNLKYEFGLCDSSWKFVGELDTIDYSYPDNFNYQNLVYRSIRVRGKKININVGGIALGEDDFTLLTQCLMPFLDTSWAEFPFEQKGYTPKNYITLKPVKFNPFQPNSQTSTTRDTTEFQLMFVNLVNPSGTKMTIMAPMQYIQEYRSTIKEDAKFVYGNSSFEAKCVEIYFRRIVRPPTLNDWKFPRQSNDTTLNKFYQKNDNEFIADIVEATFYYRKMLLIEIRIHHSTVSGDRLYKWKLLNAKVK